MTDPRPTDAKALTREAEALSEMTHHPNCMWWGSPDCDCALDSRRASALVSWAERIQAEARREAVRLRTALRGMPCSCRDGLHDDGNWECSKSLAESALLPHPEESKPDRLAETAPDLLKALKQLVEPCECYQRARGIHGRFCEDARAAIAKAESKP